MLLWWQEEYVVYCIQDVQVTWKRWFPESRIAFPEMPQKTLNTEL